MTSLIEQLFNPPAIIKNRDEYTEIFKLPIEYLPDKEKYALDDNIINDLELLNKRTNLNDENNDLCNSLEMRETNDDLSNSLETYEMSLYSKIFRPETLFGITNMNLWSKYYTTNVQFLKETQTLIQTYRPCYNSMLNNDNICVSDTHVSDNEIYNICEDIIDDDGFIERFHYIDLPLLRDFNKNETVLQFTALHNLSSPLLALLVPLVSVMLPFFIIKLQGHNITMELYIEHLKSLLGNHALAQLFVNFNETAIEKKIYIIVSLLFYGFQIYNNINTCNSYYNNIKYIHDTLKTTQQYLLGITDKIDRFLDYSRPLTMYNGFNQVVEQHKRVIISYLGDLAKIKEYKMSFKKIMELGHLMKCFYILNSETSVVEAIKYSFGFTGYINNLERLQMEIDVGNINFCKYLPNKKTRKGDNYDKMDDNKMDDKMDKKRDKKRVKNWKRIILIIRIFILLE